MSRTFFGGSWRSQFCSPTAAILAGLTDGALALPRPLTDTRDSVAYADNRCRFTLYDLNLWVGVVIANLILSLKDTDDVSYI